MGEIPVLRSLKFNTVNIGTTDTASINRDVDVMVLKLLELELLLVEFLPS